MSEHEAAAGLRAMAAPVGVGLFVSIITVLVAATVATILLFIGWDWAPYMHTVGMAIAFAGAALGGIFAGARAGMRGWLAGLLTGGGFLCLSLLICLVFGLKELAAAITISRAAIACLTAMVGGMLGVNFSG